MNYLSVALLDLDQSLLHLREAEERFLPQTSNIGSAEALQLAHAHGCSSYDAEFVLLAQELEYPLLTCDRKLLELLAHVAVKPES